MRRVHVRRGVTALALGGALAGALAPRPAAAQWVTTYEQFYYPADHNWVYRKYYPFADRLFNAFDYGHAILYEELYTKPNASPDRLERTRYDFLTRRVLPNPPRVPLEEAAIEIRYARLAPEAKQMFEWAHVLHRQSYDVLADERLSPAEKDAEIAKLLAYYKSRPDVTFSSRPKSMKLMQEQPYSLAFRRRYPKFNGLIWGYHWMQVGLYEPLVTGRTFAERQALSTAAVARFRQMLEDAPRSMPHQMPMTAAVAPEFARRYPEMAIIFDNLHSMHDVVSDILTNDAVPRDRKRAEILRAGRLFRDDTSYLVASTDAWRAMAQAMGPENMGGPAVGFTPALPTPTVSYGAVMSHDDRTGRMVAMKYGQMTGAHGGHAMEGGSAPPADPHAGHAMPPASAARPAPPPATSDSAAVATAVERYHRALVAGDSAAALALLAPGAVVLESGGAETLAEYRAHHLPADIAFARTTQATRAPVRVVVRGDVAWAASTSTAAGSYRGRPVDSAGAELMVLARDAGGWKITAIHWSSRARRPK